MKNIFYKEPKTKISYISENVNDKKNSEEEEEEHTNNENDGILSNSVFNASTSPIKSNDINYDNGEGGEEVEEHINESKEKEQNVNEEINPNENISNNNEEDIPDSTDPRLALAMIKLGLESIIHIFTNNKITFNDLLFLTKEDLNELHFHLYQKNRILSFINDYKKIAKNYTIDEIDSFFMYNSKYNSLHNTEEE